MVASFDGCADERLRTLAQSFVHHLHAFAVEVGLTQEEWEDGLLLTETGRITDERRQEFVLWSDALGLSMLVDALANPAPASATESTVLGPFYVPGAPRRGVRRCARGTAGRRPGVGPWACARPERTADRRRRARCLAERGRPALRRPGPEAPEAHLRGRFRTRVDGSYAFVAVRPVPYTIPDDGPVGNARPHRPASLAAGAHPPDRPRAWLPDGGDPRLRFGQPAPRLGRRLRGEAVPRQDFARRSADDPDRPPGVEGEWYSVENDVVLVPLDGRS